MYSFHRRRSFQIYLKEHIFQRQYLQSKLIFLSKLNAIFPLNSDQDEHFPMVNDDNFKINSLLHRIRQQVERSGSLRTDRIEVLS